MTKSGRKKADKYLESEKPDLIVAEWMYSPFSSTQNFNLGKGGALRDRILKEQRKHKKVNIWIAEKEKWQREVNKGEWLGEQPATCGSWKFDCMQPMQRENYNTLFDMCSEELKDPMTKKAYRKRTKSLHEQP